MATGFMEAIVYTPSIPFSALQKSPIQSPIYPPLRIVDYSSCRVSRDYDAELARLSTFCCVSV